MSYGEKIKFKQIFDINFGLFGISFAWVLQIANMSGIFAYLGVVDNNLGIVWLALPLGGLFAQLIVGYLSDKTTSRFGPRLPYILFGSCASAISIVLLPNITTLTTAIIIVWCFTIAINVTQQPYRPLIVDFIHKSYHTKFYAVQMIFSGLGSIAAALLPSILFYIFSNKHTVNYGIPFAIKISFAVSAVFLLISNFWTFFAGHKQLRV